jgi:MFS family permease
MPRALVPLLAITFVDVLGFTILIPILPFYAEHFGASPTVVGAIYAMFAICSLVASPYWGRLSDRIGRKGVLIAAQVACLFGFSLLAAGTALWTVFVARAIEGLGGGGLGVTQAYVTDVTTPAYRARAFGLLGATFGLAFLIGPALAGVLVRFGYQVPFVVAAALAALTLVAYGGVGFVGTVPALFAFVVLWALSSALIRPALGALISDAAPADQRGTILSVNDSLSNLAFLMAPFIATTVLQVNPHFTGIIPAAFACVAVGLGYRVFRAPRPVAAAEAA